MSTNKAMRLIKEQREVEQVFAEEDYRRCLIIDAGGREIQVEAVDSVIEKAQLAETAMEQIANEQRARARSAAERSRASDADEAAPPSTLRPYAHNQRPAPAETTDRAGVVRRVLKRAKPRST